MNYIRVVFSWTTTEKWKTFSLCCNIFNVIMRFEEFQRSGGGGSTVPGTFHIKGMSVHEIRPCGYTTGDQNSTIRFSLSNYRAATSWRESLSKPPYRGVKQLIGWIWSKAGGILTLCVWCCSFYPSLSTLLSIYFMNKILHFGKLWQSWHTGGGKWIKPSFLKSITYNIFTPKHYKSAATKV